MAKPTLSSVSENSASSDNAFGNRIQSPTFLFGLALLVLTIWAFLPSVDNDFVTYDDPDYVTSQPMVQRGLNWETVVWAFTTTDASNWHPLTWLSHALDCQLFAANAAGHHLTSLLLHAVNTLLVFLVLRALTGASWRSFFVAALFGVHPLRVESVAWVAERKDVLSTFFWMLTLLAYAAYARRAEGGGQKPEGRGQRAEVRPPTSDLGPLTSAAYWLALLFFALGLLSKPMLVTLPFVLLLLDYWPLRRVSGAGFQGSGPKFSHPATRITFLQLVVEKLPFLLLSAAACVVTFLAQRQGGAVDATIPFERRTANAVISVLRYLGKLFWPTDLAVFYPYPLQWPIWAVALAVITVLGITLLALKFRTRGPFLIIGWLWFLGTLVPVIGLVQVGQQSMADRYTYIPSLGILVALVWGGYELVLRRMGLMRPMGVLAGGAIVVCALLTRQQTTLWKNTEVLARHALAVTGENFAAYNLLGSALLRRDRIDEAVEQFRNAVRLQAASADAHSNLAVALQRQGRRDEAIGHYQLALKLRPRYPQAHYNFATALEAAGRLPEALENYSLVLRERPNFLDARFNLASVLLRLERYDEAIAQFQQVLQLSPDSPDALTNLGVAFDRKGRLDEALHCYQKVIELKPDDAKAFFNLGVALQRKGIIPDAVKCFEQAIRLQPDYAAAHTNLDAINALKAGLPAAGQPAKKR